MKFSGFLFVWNYLPGTAAHPYEKGTLVAEVWTPLGIEAIFLFNNP
jgi:hypothetical protein